MAPGHVAIAAGVFMNNICPLFLLIKSSRNNLVTNAEEKTEKILNYFAVIYGNIQGVAIISTSSLLLVSFANNQRPAPALCIMISGRP